MNNNNKMNSNDKLEILSCQPPRVFLIPRPFDDDYGRNSKWYKKMLRLGKETKVIKNKIQAIAEKQAIKKAITQQIIDKTLELNRRVINKIPKLRPT